MTDISPAEARPGYTTTLTNDEKVDLAHIEQPNQPKGLSDAQANLALAAEQEKAKSLGTFTAIKYYWVAFLWSQFASFGMVLVGYDGTVSRSVLMSEI
jgi:hypothetical protein